MFFVLHKFRYNAFERALNMKRALYKFGIIIIIILDYTLRMERQVNYLCNSCYYEIRRIGFIPKYTSNKTSKTSFQTV